MENTWLILLLDLRMIGDNCVNVDLNQRGGGRGATKFPLERTLFIKRVISLVEEGVRCVSIKKEGEVEKFQGCCK